ncbi:MAG: hypothetical protein U1D32_02195 [Patescibacteria group bacterium]|nr:hypothetical protein [Patescibacteria group bacterium]
MPTKYDLYQCPGRWKLIKAAAEPLDNPLMVSTGVSRFWMLLLESSMIASDFCHFVGVARVDDETGEPSPFGESVHWTRGIFRFNSGDNGWIEICGSVTTDPMPQIPEMQVGIPMIAAMARALPSKLA